MEFFCFRKGEKMKREIPLKVTVALIPLAIACMAFGIYRGEVDTVLGANLNKYRELMEKYLSEAE